METSTCSTARAANDGPTPGRARRGWRAILALLGILLPAFALAQQNPLHRQLSIDIERQRLDEALERVAKKGDFAYSYRPDLLPVDSLVSLHARDAQVRKVTEQLLGPQYTFKSVGNHVVIRPVEEPASGEAPPPVIEGFLIDALTGQRVRFATVYENKSRRSVLSDTAGRYRVTLADQQAQAELSISRRGYFDTVVVVDARRVHHLTVGLRPYPYANQPLASREPDLLADPIEAPLPLAEWLVGQQQRSLAENLLLRLHNIPIQVSLLPRIGTNRLLSGAMENNLSINIFAGYANGVNGIEVGGFVNLDRDRVRGLQVAGLYNGVGGDVTGLQVAGLVNHVRGRVTGLQVAGIVNTTPQPVRGVQVAGVLNRTPGEVSHVQVAGMVNLAGGAVGGCQVGGLVNRARGDVGGFQVGGLVNACDGRMGGFQIGGLVNQCDSSMGGFQIGGLVNKCGGSMGGFQLGGLANVTKGDVRGFQVAGIVNKARVVHQFQIGLVNIADSVGGYSIGLLNLPRKGYKVVEFSSNDVTQANISYKAGRRQFYNLLSIGYRFGPRHFALSYGAGFGTQHRVAGPVTWAFEASCHDVIEQGLGPGRLNLLIPTRLQLGIDIGQHLEVFAGAGHNLHISNPHNAIGEFKSELQPAPLWRNGSPSTLVQGWIGYQAGLRFGF